MSAGCCGGDMKFDGLSTAYKRALWAVIAINGAMFLVELGAGVLAGSQLSKQTRSTFWPTPPPMPSPCLSLACL